MDRFSLTDAQWEKMEPFCLGPSFTVRKRNSLIEREKSRFEAVCDAKWPISAGLPAAKDLR